MTTTSSLRGKSAIVGVGTAGLGEAPRLQRNGHSGPCCTRSTRRGGAFPSKMSTACFAPI